MALPEGSILAGKYVICRVLGQGGFGITYLAKIHKTDEKVAIKEFFPESMVTRPGGNTVKTYTDERLENFRYGKERFLEEAKILSQFQKNPHIAGVQTCFEENGTAYFVMDYVQDTDFKTYLKGNGGKLPWNTVWDIMPPVMEALETVHQAGLIHRDVTPDNIFISSDKQVRLLDFGSARYSLGDRSRSLDVILKPGYAPKEQYTRRGIQGPFTDVYSVAACFYAALSGYLPPESLDRMEEDDLVPLSNRGVQLPKKAEEAILKGLELRAEDRFQTMGQFRQAIVEALNPPNSNPEPDPAPDPIPGRWDFLKNHRTRIALSAIAAAIIAIICIPIIGSKSTDSDTYPAYVTERECVNGHIYDADMYQTCPYCNDFRTIDFGGVPVGQSGETLPGRDGMYGRNSRSASDNDNKTMPPRDHRVRVGEANKTVGVMRGNRRNEPVVGWLICISGINKGKDYRLYGRINTVGRSETMDVSCDSGDPAVTRDIHIRIGYDPKNNNFHIIPANGTNNTYVNEEPVYMPVQLNAYDLIELGATRLLFVPLCNQQFSWEGGLNRGDTDVVF